MLEQIEAIEAERDAAVAEPAAGDADAAKVALLAKLGGIGTELATVLVREALYRPFANRKEVAAYAGLTPSPFASGDRHRDQGISKAGNPLLRKSMIELAWLWLRYQPDSALARWFAERVGTIRGADAQDHRRRPGQEAAGRLVEVRHDGAVARGGSPEGRLTNKVRPARRLRRVGRAGVACDRSSTGFCKPSPKMGPATPSRLALHEASWSGTRMFRRIRVDAASPSLAIARLTPACTAPGSLDNGLRYAARLKVWSCQAARMASGLRCPFFSISHSAL